MKKSKYVSPAYQECRWRRAKVDLPNFSSPRTRARTFGLAEGGPEAKES